MQNFYSEELSPKIASDNTAVREKLHEKHEDKVRYSAYSRKGCPV